MGKTGDMPHFPDREPDAHKGRFGRVLVVGGSLGMPGAPSLAGLSALRAGAGLVKIACPACVQPTVAGLCPCATSEPLAQSQRGLIARTAIKRVVAMAEENDVVAVGPGMGVSPAGAELIAGLLALTDKPVVIDADGLNNLASRKSWWGACRAQAVLTPHPGEMRRLLEGAGLKADIREREACCAGFAARTGQVVVLKGFGTVVSDGTQVYVNHTGNPGMATGGSGDVLTGVIAALLGQGLDAFDAAAMGVYLHGLAGDLAAGTVGQVSLIAIDLINFLPAAILKLKNMKMPAAKRRKAE